MFKEVTLMREHWQEILAILDRAYGADPKYAAMFREQFDGSVKVKASRSGSATTKAGNLRNRNIPLDPAP